MVDTDTMEGGVAGNNRGKVCKVHRRETCGIDAGVDMLVFIVPTEVVADWRLASQQSGG